MDEKKITLIIGADEGQNSLLAREIAKKYGTYAIIFCMELHEKNFLFKLAAILQTQKPQVLIFDGMTTEDIQHRTGLLKELSTETIMTRQIYDIMRSTPTPRKIIITSQDKPQLQDFNTSIWMRIEIIKNDR